jgi:hypothetical protein
MDSIFTLLLGSNVLQACMLLLGSNIMVGSVMTMVYCLGKDSIVSSLLIYAPVSMISAVLVRDKYPTSYLVSNILAIGHGIAHVTYPFLNEHIGVDKSVDVWQDQIIHLGQSVLVGAIFFSSSDIKFRASSLLFVMCNLINVILGYNCWGQWCHNLYVWISLAPALASGLHFATGTLFQNNKHVAKYGFIIQGASSVITFFLFKSSNDMLKLFAACRFFEIYFIVPHYTGFFYGRYIIHKNLNHKSSAINTVLEIIGVRPMPPCRPSYFNVIDEKHD